MKRIILFIFLCSFNFIFSQKKDFEIQLNHYEVIVTKNYGINKGHPDKEVIFSNKNDSTYLLKLRTSKHNQEARFFDFKNKVVIDFKIDKINFNLEDLQNLKKPKTGDYYFHKHNKIIDNKSIEIFEFQRDTLTNKAIAHITKYENDKLKKIVHEDYLIFEKKYDFSLVKQNEYVSSIIKKHDLNLIEGESLKQLLCLNEGKISTDIIYLENKDFDFNFKFSLK